MTALFFDFLDKTILHITNGDYMEMLTNDGNAYNDCLVIAISD